MILKVGVLAGTLALGLGAQNYNAEADTPFFCNLKALTAAERKEHLQLSQRLGDAVLKTAEVADGYAFEIDRRRVSIKDLAAWTDFEQRCCPFFDFTIEWRRENGPMTLRLTGRDGVKQFIRSEFARIFR
jgi:hypothetical protein